MKKSRRYLGVLWPGHPSGTEKTYSLLTVRDGRHALNRIKRWLIYFGKQERGGLGLDRRLP